MKRVAAPFLPESPHAAGKAIGTAEAFHQGQQNAHGGEDADEDRAPDNTHRPRVVVEEVVLDQLHGVRREQLLERVPDDAAQVIA